MQLEVVKNMEPVIDMTIAQQAVAAGEELPTGASRIAVGALVGLRLGSSVEAESMCRRAVHYLCAVPPSSLLPACWHMQL